MKYKVVLTDSASFAANGTLPVTFAPPIEPDSLRAIERQLHLRFNKWDTQVGDVSVLCEHPLVIRGSEWDGLCAAAEALAAETEQLEARILDRPRDLADIGIPRKLSEVVRRSTGPVTPNLRLMRFDFHLTEVGWRVSEVNSDVPGGWREGSSLPQLYRPFYASLDCPDSPLDAWGRAIESIAPRGHVALLSAPGYLEDQQVLRSFCAELLARKIASSLIQSPAALEWSHTGGCRLLRSGIAVSAIIRFYQIEWLCALSRGTRWQRLLESREPPVFNPTIAAISESKRFPLLFQGTTGCPTWNAFLPECRDPRGISIDWDSWVLKASYSNTGDHVVLVGDLPRKQKEQAIRRAQRRPFDWVAQRRFVTVPLETSRGSVFPCVGVFVVAGRAAGAYVRLSTHQVTDGAALDNVPSHRSNRVPMTNESIYDIWRPADSPWKQWVKPVIFPFLRPAVRDGDDYLIRDWPVPLCAETAIVVDLPGAEGISAGIAMARGGYRPVLLYNACPDADYGDVLESGPRGHADSATPPVVDMASILVAVCATTKELASLSLPEQAPPVFVLDANRRGGYSEPGWFDNRSFVTVFDFPSVDYLRCHGIARVVLVQPSSETNMDILQVLLQMQRSGMTMGLQAPWVPWDPRPHIFKPPNFFVTAWEWLRRKVVYRRNDFDSSFGGVIPHSSG